MSAKKTISWSGCPVRFAAGILGDKWTLLILRDLMFKGKCYYSEFTDSEESIATNILADRLKKLDRQGLVSKQTDPNNKAKFIYSLTAKGLDLLPVMLEIIDWSERYDEYTEVPREFITELRKNRQQFEQKLLAQLTGCKNSG